MSLLPEQQARVNIDAALREAGRVTQDRAEMNISASRGVAIREFLKAKAHLPI
jgi:type I restriction enzyme R subunit